MWSRKKGVGVGGYTGTGQGGKMKEGKEDRIRKPV